MALERLIGSQFIGADGAALKKKPFELHALRGIKTLKAARAGGDGRRGKFEPKTRAVLVEMERLVAQGHTLSRAAELGGGSSGCATTVIRESLGSVSGLGQFSGYYRWLARQCRYD